MDKPKYPSAIRRWRHDIGKGVEFYEQQLWGYRCTRSGSVEYVSMHERLTIKTILIQAYRDNLVEAVGPGQWTFP